MYYREGKVKIIITLIIIYYFYKTLDNTNLNIRHGYILFIDMGTIYRHGYYL